MKSPAATRRLVVALAALTVWIVSGAMHAAPVPAVRSLPARLTDQEFWRLVEEMSEPNGYFRSDNLVGNERPLQQVVPALRKLPRGGVYLGVAPDQNFTYITALEPRIAFILDIRRGNLDEHLMYKALFELSADRAEFVSRLFSKKRPQGLSSGATASELMNAYWNVATDDDLYKRNLQDIERHLQETHKFALTDDDVKGIEYVYWSFYYFGPAITYASSQSVSNGGRGPGNMPSWADLQVQTDLSGRSQSYLSSEEAFAALKALESKNLIVPIVGDFAGSKALRAIGHYLDEHGATVTAYYTSNVEQYLFQDGVWGRFYENVAALPLTDASVFIRSARQQNLIDPIQALIADYRDGRIRSYADVVARGTVR